MRPKGVLTTNKVRRSIKSKHTFYRSVKSDMNPFERETCRILMCHVDDLLNDPERLKTEFLIKLISEK
jgi:archaellum component FlaC